MATSEQNEKLDNNNWDYITLRNYNLTFLTERNAIRVVLYDLLQIDNDIKCTNVEIQALKTNFASQLAFMENEVEHLQQSEFLEPEEKNRLITQQVKLIENTNAAFSKEVEKYQLLKEEKCKQVSLNADKLFKLKSQFKYTHQEQIESLRRFKMFCNRDIRAAVDIRLKSVNRKFCDEFFYINACEKNLEHIFSLIEDRSSHSGVCASATSSTNLSDVCSDFFTDFNWMRNEQLTKCSELFDYFKKYIAKDLREALASMHVHQPEEPIKYIANYLKHLKQNEFRLKKQEQIFAAAKYGEQLFPEVQNNTEKGI